MKSVFKTQEANAACGLRKMFRTMHSQMEDPPKVSKRLFRERGRRADSRGRPGSLQKLDLAGLEARTQRSRTPNQRALPGLAERRRS